MLVYVVERWLELKYCKTSLRKKEEEVDIFLGNAQNGVEILVTLFWACLRYYTCARLRSVSSSENGFTNIHFYFPCKNFPRGSPNHETDCLVELLYLQNVQTYG